MRDDDLSRAVSRALAGRTVAAAESCTAGRIVASLAGVDRASEFLRGGVVAYQESVKRSLLGVSAVSVYSEEAVGEMAAAVRRILGADVGVATSGVAAPRRAAQRDRRARPDQRRRRSAMTAARAACAPHAPCTPPPGWADAEARKSPPMWVSGRARPIVGRNTSC